MRTMMNRQLKVAPLILFFALNLSAAYLQAQKQPTGGGRDITFKITTPLEFKGRILSGSLRQSEIEKLLDLPVRNGVFDPSAGYGVEMTRPDYITLAGRWASRIIFSLLAKARLAR
jgi:hypothetical protein